MSRLQETAVLEGHLDRVWCVAWSPDGKLLASCSGDKTVRVWCSPSPKEESAAGSCKWPCAAVLEDGVTRTVRCCDWSPCGRFLATVSFDGTCSIWARQQRDTPGVEFELSTTLEGHENEVKSVAWNKGGNLLATCGRDKTVWIWEHDEAEGEFECVTVLSDHTADVKSVKWLPHVDVLVSCSYDDTIRFWAEDFDDWFLVDTLQGHSSTVWSIAVEGGGRRLASVGDDRALILWRHVDDGTKHGKWQRDLTFSSEHGATIYGVDWAPTAADVAAARAAAARRVFATGQDSHGDEVGSSSSLSSSSSSSSSSAAAAAAAAASSSAGGSRYLATAAGDDALRVFHEEGSGMDASFTLDVEVKKAHAGDVNCVRWCPTGGGVLSTCGDDELVRVWLYTPPGC